MNDIRYSRWNLTNVKSTNADLRALATKLHQAIQVGRKKILSKDQSAELRRHIDLIVADLLAAYRADLKLYIAYSRRMKDYARGGTYWDHTNDRAMISKTYYLQIVNYLVGQGLIEHTKAEAGWGGISSRMRVAPALAKIFDAAEATWASITTDLNAPHIIVKDDNKKPIPPPNEDDFDLPKAVENLRRINQNLQSTFINLDVDDQTYRSLQRRFSGILDNDKVGAEPDDELGELREPFDFSNRTLRRIFAGGTFKMGGRFYGGWWQGVPEDYRKFIEIDGAVTREMDFSTMQPRILYATTGGEPPKDSYVIEGWPQTREFRDKIVKKLFSQLINSSRGSRNPNQWHRFSPAWLPDPKPPGWEDLNPFEQRQASRQAFQALTGRDYSELISDLLEMHKPIEDAFFSRSWGRIQRLDSDIAEEVMIEMLSREVPVTVLPVHDSFIVRRGEEAALYEAMSKAFRDVVGVDGVVDRGDAVYDPPENAVMDRLVFGNQLRDDTRAHMQDHAGYHIRKREWTDAWGPID